MRSWRCAVSKFTPWFSGEVAPVHAGVYERRYHVGSSDKFAKFDGRQWFCGCETVREAAAESVVSVFAVGDRDFDWRGLLKEQSNV